jgi:hypothetical protein
MLEWVAPEEMFMRTEQVRSRAKTSLPVTIMSGRATRRPQEGHLRKRATLMGKIQARPTVNQPRLQNPLPEN